MKNAQSLLIHLQSWLQAEVAAQRGLALVLERLEQAARAGSTEPLAQAGAALDEALDGNLGRDARRRSLMERFGALWGVPAETLSVSSVLTRADEAGLSVTQLTPLRDELRAVVEDVARRARLLNVVAAHHRGVLAELMAILGGSSTDEDARRAGVLVDARG